MGRLYDIIPGKQIDNIIIVDKLFEVKKNALINNYVRVDEFNIFETTIKNDEYYYLIYLDPKGIINRYFICEGSELIDFIQDRIDSYYGNGIDMLIVNLDFIEILMTTHDGDIYLNRKFI